MPHTDPEEIKKNLIAQLTAPVLWTQIVQKMIADGADDFTELGPGAVLQGLIRKIDRSVATSGSQCGYARLPHGDCQGFERGDGR